MNGQSYVGSSVNLARRFTDYFNINYISNKTNNMVINKALLKYGYANFSLEILEYCESDQLRSPPSGGSPLAGGSREQYFLDFFKPEYNTFKFAGSPLGFKHTEETIAKLKAKFKDRVFTPEHLAKLSEAKIGHQNATGGKGRERAEGAGSPSVPIEVLDQETGIKTTYPSMREVALALGVPSGSIRMYLSRNSQKPYKGRFLLLKINSTTTELTLGGGRPATGLGRPPTTQL